MKIYIDACSYSRPFDNREHMEQARVRAEASAVMSAVHICGVEGFSVIGSPMAIFEINKIKNDDKRQNVMRLYNDAITASALLTNDVDARAEELMTQGVKRMDAYHIAFAEAAEADYLLTTDDRLEAAALRLGVKTKVINPIKFLQEYTVWLQSSM
jgi:predicted nucleic acid-binding protein